MNDMEEEPGLVGLVKSEAALLVKEEVVGDGRQDIAELQCGPSTSTIVGSMDKFDSIGDLHNILNVKEELGAIDIGPTVLQHTDMWYTTNQKDVSVVKQEHTMNHDNLNPILCGGVKEEIIEDEWRVLTGAGPVLPAGSLTTQDSLMEQPGACTALHSLRNKCLEMVCRVELRRLDTFQCEVCDAVYIDAHKLLQHVQEVHGTGPKRSLDRHVKSPQISNGPQQCATVSSPVVYTCDYCHKIYTTKRGLIYHMDVVHTKVRYRCSECNKEYTRKLSLQAHIRRVHTKEKHEVSSRVVYTCDYCHKTYSSRSGLFYHTNVVHTKLRYRCSECNKEFTGKHLLQKHVKKVHSKEEHEGSEPRTYICDYCKNIFTNKLGVQQHIARMHTGGSHKCDQCNKIFKCKQYLTTHKSKVHTAADTDAQRSNEASQSEQRTRYSCDKCVKTYSSKNILMEHYRNLHSTESHKCHKCNKKFPSKSYLYRHTSRTHSEQQYECAVCKKICKSKAALNNHVYYTHRPRPAGSHQLHACTNCGKNFKSKRYCREHEKRGKCTRPTASSTSAVASTSLQRRNVVIVKEEPADEELELGPVVFQHMDCNYRPYKQEPQLD